MSDVFNPCHECKAKCCEICAWSGSVVKAELLKKAHRYHRAESKMRRWLTSELIGEADMVSGTIKLKTIYLDVSLHANKIRDMANEFYSEATAN